MYRVCAAAVLMFSFVACSEGGSSSQPTVAEAKACLQDLGFTTDEEPGIISLVVEGEDVDIDDQFMAIMGDEQFAIWFLAPGVDARAVADALGGFMDPGQGTPLFETPQVDGQILLARGTGASLASASQVQGCLGF
jgi:hypothetical protein